MAKRIGLLGGSFDPIHFGHVNLALEMVEKDLVDEVIFIPAYLSPFKVENPPVASRQQRLEMVRLAIEGIEQFSCCDYEILKNTPSYTIDTIKHFLSMGHKNLFLILAQDAANEIDKWKNSKEILELAPPLVGKRKECHGLPKDFPSGMREILEKNTIAIRNLEISSTDIRKRFKKEFYCRHLVPAKVLDYIYKNHLYFST